MNDNQQTLDPLKVLADIQVLVRVALESADPDVIRRDLELILTITERRCSRRTKSRRGRSVDREETQR
jgi:hypothetical protein